MTPLTTAERNRIRSRIATALCNLEAFTLYWIPDSRRAVARSLSVTRRFSVPAGAVLVGTYERGITAGEVLADLAEVIEQTRIDLIP